jgi:hypothetical protein|tara:strand:+ start:185 stop:1006 length:822 start_codon:yes stop_codon:yes gene_type:complete
MQKKLSVILPIYWKNDFEGLKKTFTSILRQTLQANEIIIIYDGYVDIKIIKYIKTQKKLITIKEIKNKKNIGLGKSLNKAVKLCSFEFIIRADCDDFNYKDRFKKQLNFMIKYNLDISGGYTIESDTSKKLKILKINPKNHENISKKMKFRNPISHQTVIFKKNSVLKAGNYEDVPYFEDYFLWIKMLKCGYRLGNMNRVLVNVEIDKDFYNRRAGLKYFKDYLYFLKKCKKINFINILEYIRLSLFRFSIYILPITLVKKFYYYFLRKKIRS